MNELEIPAEAVEAAAKALWEPNERDDEWVGEYETYKDYLRAQATKVLEAAAPYMRAQALDEAAKKLRSDMDVPQRLWVAGKVRALAMIERGDG